MERQRYPRYLLGVLDEPITDSNKHLVSWNTSKIGGIPDLINPDFPSPVCRVCQWDLALVVQIYAPLEGSPYHRTLHVYGCINNACWTKSESWAVFRSEKLDETNLEQRQDATGQSQAIEWLDSADDWESEDNDEDQEGNPISASPLSGSPRHYGAQGRQGPSCWERSKNLPDLIGDSLYRGGNVIQNQTELMDPCNINNRDSPCILDEQGNTRDIFVEECLGASAVTENFRKFHLHDSSGNGAMEGAVGISHDLDASAEIEPPDEGTITLDTPLMPSAESIASIFGCRSGSFPHLGTKPVLKSYFLAVVEEIIVERELLNEHERELLSLYQRQEGLNINQLYNITKQLETGSGAVEIYEKTIPKHGDRQFHKLRNRLAACPNQLLRYCKDPEAFPVYLNAATADELDAGKCSYCGGPRSFEMQIMPTAVDFMRISGVADPVLEFGTVIVYTCRDSCWKDGDNYHEEKVVVQADPDDQLFKAITSNCEI